MKRNLTSGEAFSQEMLDEVLPLLSKKIEALQLGITTAYNALAQDQELMSNGYMASYVKLMNGIAEGRLCVAKNCLCLIKSLLATHQPVTAEEAAQANALLMDSRQALSAAQKTMEDLEAIRERREVLFEVFSLGSDLAS